MATGRGRLYKGVREGASEGMTFALGPEGWEGGGQAQSWRRRGGRPPAPEELERVGACHRLENPYLMNHSHKANENCAGAVSRQLASDEKERRGNHKMLEKSFPDRQLAHHSEIQRMERRRLSPITKRHFSY